MSSAAWAGLPGRTPSSHRLETHHDQSRTPGRMLFVNIPVADRERSKAFFAKLGGPGLQRMPTPRQVAAISKGLGESIFSGSPREQSGRRQHLPGDDRIHAHPFPRRRGRDIQLCRRLNTQHQEAGQAEDTKPK